MKGSLLYYFLNMATDTKKVNKSAKGKQPTNDEIYAGFQLLRNEQRHLAGKLSEMELDLNEHKIVIDTLKNLDGDRKCYRMIGGILCEKTVKEVLPSLITNRDQLTNVIESLSEQLTKKGVEINEYKEKHNIRIRGHEETPINSSSTEEGGEKKSDSSRSNIMVNPIG